MHLLQLQRIQYEVNQAFYEYQYQSHKYLALKKADSLLDYFSESYVSDTTKSIEELTALYQLKKWKIGLFQSKKDVSIAANRLKGKAFIKKDIQIERIALTPLPMPSMKGLPILGEIYDRKQYVQLNKTNVLKKTEFTRPKPGLFSRHQSKFESNIDRI